MEADMYGPCGKYPEGGDTYNTSGPVLGTFDPLADLPDHRLAPKWKKVSRLTRPDDSLVCKC